MPPMFGTSAEKLTSPANEAYPPRRQAILIVDEDLGFVWWLGTVLAEAGYQTIPALSCRQALSRIKKLNGSLGAVIVNPTLPGGHRFLETLGNLHRRLNTILIHDPSADVPRTDPWRAVLEKPRAGEAISRHTWLQRAKQALAHAGTDSSTCH